MVPPTFDCLREEGRLLFILGFVGTKPLSSESSTDKSDNVVSLLLLFIAERSWTAAAASR